MRPLFQDFEHLFRMGGLFVLGTTGILVLRSFLIPADFGIYGHFRAGALDDNAAQANVYAGRDACLICHDDVAESRAGGAHERIGCESCHGPLAAHAEEPAAIPSALPRIGLLCVKCHTVNAARPRTFPQVDVAEHAGDAPCGDCHMPHNPGFE